MKGVFMILFECDIGYIPGFEGRYNNKTLDEVTIVDSKRYLGIITQYGGSFPRRDRTVEQFNAEGLETFGEDFSKIWLLPWIKNNYTNAVWNYGWVPSATYMYPNIWDTVNALQSGAKINPIVIFRKLGKAFSNGTAYEIVNNRFVFKADYWTPYYCNQSFVVPILSNYTSGMDLRTATWLVLEATVNTGGERRSEVYSSTEFTLTMSWLLENNPTPDVEPTDPYTPGGNSDLAGGTGDFDGSSTPIDFPELPTLSAVDTGLISLFNPSVAEIKSLATFMWGPPFDMENWKKLFANPMDALLGLSIVPVHVPDGGQGTVKVGNIDTNISMNKAGSQYTEVDCGSLNINEYWGAYLDYEPYTHVQLYLPYIGVKEISTDDVMSKSVHIKYHVDILSGACVAYVKCGTSVLYSFTGQCAASIPITGRDYTGVVQSAINIVSSAMGMFAMGQSASALGQAANLAKSAGATARLSAGAARNALGAASGAANIASEAINMTKPGIQKSANISSASGLLGIQVPYMILTRPRQCLPANQNRYIGYPSMITSPLSSCSGFTVVEAIHLENIGATEEEIAEIESILHAGVIC
jgi:hypothetical protein